MANNKKLYYCSDFSSWEEKSAVKTLRLLDKWKNEGDDHYNYLCPTLVEINFHPSVIKNDENFKKTLQKRHLLRYLASTEVIEIELVNLALQYIMKGNFPHDFIFNAYKIYTDEGFHALMCLNLREKICRGQEDLFFQRYVSEGLNFILRTIEALSDDKERQMIIILLAACINETLISASLLKTIDATVYPEIKNVIKIHAQDEAIHHGFFSDFFVFYWNALSSENKKFALSYIPTLLEGLMMPDHSGMMNDLNRMGFSEIQSRSIVNDCYPKGPIHHDSHPVLRGTMTMFKRCGISVV